MGEKASRVDAYIGSAGAFARPILRHLRSLVHRGCPDVVETMKWSFPHFLYKGMFCSMAAFKAHCAFGFWKGSLIVEPGDNRNREAMGQFGRLTSVRDLPSDQVILGFLRRAVELNEAGVKSPARVRRPTPRPLRVPAILRAALETNAKARRTFEEFTPSHKREYVEWITEAKTEETRARRLATAIDWMSRGKTRNWRYAR